MKFIFDSHILAALLRQERPVPEGLQSIHFTWPNILCYCGIEDVFSSFFIFDEQHSLYEHVLKLLKEKGTHEDFIHFFDLLFAECLTHVSALPFVDISYLLNAASAVTPPSELIPYINQTLEEWKSRLISEPKALLHDLKLYLAWDRLNVALETLFDSALLKCDPRGLEALKDCLIESFQFITLDGKSKPSFFRLCQTLWVLNMREEKLQHHSDEDWEKLSKSTPALFSRDHLADAPQIDEAMGVGEKILTKIYTYGPQERIIAEAIMGRFFYEKIKEEHTDWPSVLTPAEVDILV